MFEVTVQFKDRGQFDKFLDKNGIESYTWNKNKGIIIDLSKQFQEEMKSDKAMESLDLPEKETTQEEVTSASDTTDDSILGRPIESSGLF